MNPVYLDNFNQGGLSDSKWSGKKYSQSKLVGFDPHLVPGLLKTAQKMTKYSGTTIDEFCKETVASANGINYWFSSTSGKIWQDKAGTITLVYTTSAAAGTHGCSGAFEYQGYMYWATQSRLHRIPIDSAKADGSSAWTTNAVPNWKIFSITDASFHPMVIQNQVLYIGDGNYLAQVDAGVFSANALDIVTPLRIKSLGKLGTDVLLGTYVADTVTTTQIIRWNTWSVSFTSSDDIPEIGINAFLPMDNMVLVSCGNAGRIYKYNGTILELYKTIPGTYTPTATCTVHPSSVANLGGDVLFGVSNVSGNPCDELVYRFGRNSANYPYILDAPYPISERSGGAFVMSSIEIGGILVSGSNVYVAWKNGTTYGVDKLDYSNKLDGAYIETIVTVHTLGQNNLSDIAVLYSSLPANTAVSIYTDINYAGYGSALTTVTDTQRNVIRTKDIGTEFTTMQTKFVVTASGNTAPDIQSVALLLS